MLPLKLEPDLLFERVRRPVSKIYRPFAFANGWDSVGTGIVTTILEWA